MLLSVDVNESGEATDVKVVRSLGLGLDEKAMDAVKQWHFKPGTANGIPVTMQTQVKVDFRLFRQQVDSIAWAELRFSW